jgi:transcriptional regulator with XRE-family HTH domain
MEKIDTNKTEFVEQLRHSFNTRLRSQIQNKNISISQLAKFTGISRSVLSGYIKDDPALPNVANLMRLAQALDCEPGAFFPITSTTEQRSSVSDFVNISLSMVDHDQLDQTLGKIAAATEEFIYYVPRTLPDVLKTDDVFAFEDCLDFKNDNNSYVKKIRSSISPALCGVILISEQTLLDLIYLRGIYASLPQKISDHQMTCLVNACHKHYPNFQIKVFRNRDFQISPCLMIGNSFLIQEFFNYNIQIESVPTILGVQACLNTTNRMAIDFLYWVKSNAILCNDQQKK